jgi:ABC-type Mn2+/Zn2+ transport system ATPase subunit
MVKQFNDINLMFIDEIFQGIHKNNIELVLMLLSKLSKELKMNLVIVHPDSLDDMDYRIFDSILSVEKDGLFSDIIKMKGSVPSKN